MLATVSDLMMLYDSKPHTAADIEGKGRDRDSLHSYCSTILVWQVSRIVIQIMTLECLQETVCMYKKYSNLHLNFAQPLEMGLTLRSTLFLLKQAELLLEKKKNFWICHKNGL